MLKLPTGRKRKWVLGLSVTTVVAVVAGISVWQIAESRERAELARELAGEGMPKALARHIADTVPENKIEGMEGPTSAAEEHFQALAYPDSDISLSKAAAATDAYAKAQSRGNGKDKKVPGVWTSLGPTKAVYPAFLNRHFSEYVTSGRVTSMALDPDCTLQKCTLWVGAAGGGVWRTP